MASELYIKRDDAIRAVLHNEGQAAVAAVENIKQINPHGEMRAMLIDEMIDRANRPMNNAELIAALRCEKDCDDCAYHTDNAWSRCDEWGMRCDAADALEAAEKRIAELEALMPKEGEWKKILQNGDGTSDYQCSACLGIIMDVPDDDEHSLCSFCPNCGAMMRTVTDCHTLEER